jgi:parvulin-like peptidyl-prolyl isomerase
MDRISRGRLRIGAALLFLVVPAGTVLSGCGAKPVAAVNGTKLSEKEFARLCETTTRVAPQQGTVGMQVLAQWIGNTIITQQAKERNLYPSEQELEARIQARQREVQYAGMDLDEMLRQQGRDMAAFREETLASMVQEAVFFEGVNVTDAELQEAFNSQKVNYTIPESVQFAQITLDSEQAKNEAVNELASGAQFALVARTRSKDPFAQNGGQVPMPMTRTGVPRGGPVAQEAVDAAFKLKAGDTSDPIKVGATWVIVRLEKKTERKEPKFEDFREIIRAQLRSQKAQSTGKSQENQQKFMQMASQADIQINRPQYVALLNQFRAAPPGAPAGPVTGMDSEPPPAPGG